MLNANYEMEWNILKAVHTTNVGIHLTEWNYKEYNLLNDINHIISVWFDFNLESFSYSTGTASWRMSSINLS